MYPETGTTKAEVIAYYARDRRRSCCRTSPDRPVTRKRWVHGVGTADDPGQVFFEKNLAEHAPEWVRRGVASSTPTAPTTYPIVERPRDASSGSPRSAALEIHVPQWRFDAARAARRTPTAWCSTSTPARAWASPSAPRSRGSCATLLAGMGLEPCRSRAAARASTSTRRSTARRPRDRSRRSRTSSPGRSRPTIPSSSSASMKKTLRSGKVLIDWSQNNGNKTTIAPYSLRGRPGRRSRRRARGRSSTTPGLRQLDVSTRCSQRVDEAAATRCAALTGGLARRGRSADVPVDARRRGKTPEPMPASAWATGERRASRAS